MDEPYDVPSGQGENGRVFTLMGRGFVLVFKGGFSRIIPGNGVVQSKRGKSAYSEPEFIDGSGLRRNWLGMVARASEAAGLLQPDEAAPSMNSYSCTFGAAAFFEH